MKKTLDLLNIIAEYMNDCSHISFPTVVDKPRGIKQNSDCSTFDHEYVSQQCGYLGDDFSGCMYFPLSDGRYLEVGYSC
jgi:hypothetical protein